MKNVFTNFIIVNSISPLHYILIESKLESLLFIVINLKFRMAEIHIKTQSISVTESKCVSACTSSHFISKIT